MTSNPTYSNIGDRMKDYFTRQVQHFETLSEDLSSTEYSDDLDAVAKRRQEQETITRTLAQEFWSLKREWDTEDDISPQSRADVQRLASRADELTRTLQELISSAVDVSEEYRRSLDASMGKIRQGKEFLSKYKSEEPDQHDFVDRKA